MNTIFINYPDYSAVVNDTSLTIKARNDKLNAMRKEYVDDICNVITKTICGNANKNGCIVKIIESDHSDEEILTWTKNSIKTKELILGEYFTYYGEEFSSPIRIFKNSNEKYFTIEKFSEPGFGYQIFKMLPVSNEMLEEFINADYNSRQEIWNKLTKN